MTSLGNIILTYLLLSLLLVLPCLNVRAQEALGVAAPSCNAWCYSRARNTTRCSHKVLNQKNTYAQEHESADVSSRLFALSQDIE